MTAQWKSELAAAADSSKVDVFNRFFKTGPGEYGHGDTFIGISVPDNRAISRRYHDADIADIDSMIDDPVHEYRLAGLLALVERYRRNRHDDARQSIASHYVAVCHKANSWDLVDLSAPYILGHELTAGRNADTVRRLAASPVLWERRVAVVSTLTPVRNGDTDLAYELCDRLLTDPHPLMRKATGWVLRECGKRDRRRLDNFLETNIARISAITLSYAIEKHDKPERDRWRAMRRDMTAKT